MKAFKNRTFSIVLFVVILMVAVFYFNSGSARAAIQILKHQRVQLIIEASDHRNLSDDLGSDIYVSTDDESSSDDEENDDDEEDDDWEA